MLQYSGIECGVSVSALCAKLIQRIACSFWRGIKFVNSISPLWHFELSVSGMEQLKKNSAFLSICPTTIGNYYMKPKTRLNFRQIILHINYLQFQIKCSCFLKGQFIIYLSFTPQWVMDLSSRLCYIFFTRCCLFCKTEETSHYCLLQ